MTEINSEYRFVNQYISRVQAQHELRRVVARIRRFPPPEHGIITGVQQIPYYISEKPKFTEKSILYANLERFKSP